MSKMVTSAPYAFNKLPSIIFCSFSPRSKVSMGHVSCVRGVWETWASSPGTRLAQNSGKPAVALQKGLLDQTEAPGHRRLLFLYSPWLKAP